MLKLPKSLQTPGLDLKLQTALKNLNQPLYEASDLEVPVLQIDEKLSGFFSSARRSGHLVGGFDKILRQLRNEHDGIVSLKAKGTDNGPQSLTRLLFLTNDGSTRFYRNARIAANQFDPWLGLVRINIDPETCARQFFGSKSKVKALLLDQKEWVIRFFETWLEESGTNE